MPDSQFQVNNAQSIDESVDVFINSLKSSQRPEDSQSDFDRLVQSLTFDVFKRIKEIDELIGKVKDQKDREVLITEKEDLKKELQKTVNKIAILADNYLSERG